MKKRLLPRHIASALKVYEMDNPFLKAGEQMQGESVDINKVIKAAKKAARGN